MERRGIPDIIGKEDAERRQYAETLDVLRVMPEYGSSGLWNEKNQMIDYDSIDLPFPLIRRLSAWQRNYDDTLIPLLPKSAPDVWWEAFEHEQREITRELQLALGDRVRVEIR